MVSFSNGCVSGDASNKRPLENGYFPKYKPRKISAVRDFPPHCGRNAVLVNMNPEENGANASGIMESPGFKNSEIFDAEMVNGVETLMVADILDPKAVESFGVSKKIETDGCNTAEMPEAVQLDKIKNSEMAGPPGAENSNIRVLCRLDAGKDSEDVSMTEQMDASVEVRPLEIQLPNDNVVNNPLEVEEVEPLDALVGKVTTMTAVDGSLDDVEKLMTETALVDVEKQDEIKNVSSKVPLLVNSQVVASSTDGSLSNTSIRRKDKYCQRSVSAVRDFPPHCGRNYPVPIVSEKSMVNEKVDVDPEGTISHVVPEGPAEEMIISQKEHLDEADNIHVERETAETLNYGGKGPLGEMMEDIKQDGSMDLEEYNRQAEPGSATMANAFTDTGFEDTEKSPVRRETVACSPYRDDNEWTPESGYSMGNESCREIVHGLAAPNGNCPRRKGKVALNGPENGSRGVNVRRQNLSRQKKPKAADLKSNLKENCSGGPSVVNDVLPDSCRPEGSPGSHLFMNEDDNGTYDECAPLITPISMSPPVIDSDDDSTGKEIVVYSPGQSDELGYPRPVSSPADEEVDREVVHGLMAAPDPPSRKGKTVSSEADGKVSVEKKGTQKFSWRLKAKAVARKSTPKAKVSGSRSKKSSGIHISNDADESPSELVPAGNEAENHDGDFLTKAPSKRKMMNIEVSLPPFGPKGSGNGDARNRVRETLRTFNALCRKLLQQDESNTLQEEGKSTGKKLRRIDLLSAKAIKDMGKEVNTEKLHLGSVPGVEVGDEFQYRVELAVVGIHRLYQAGIDSIKKDGMLVATSIVSSGAYQDDVDNADVLIYSGQGGNVVGKTKQPEDQKLEKGNLALYNSISEKTPVRVIRGWKEPRVMDPLDPKPKMVTIYVYDGLYTVTRYWPQLGPHGKQVFMFELRRNPGQPELAWKELKKTNKFKLRPGMVVSDISGGKEPFSICAVNTSDEQKPPPFNYISKMMYPEWFKPKPPAGCDCTARCSDSKRCRCAVRNGGEIPYNRNGAIVETKPLVYECGPHCRCPPSCYNRVTQRGIKFQLEIFKTGLRGWGVRALTSIPSGSFICEYAGELLEDKEAEERVGNDEYLFDIGHNYSDASVMSEEKAPVAELEEGGYTIDAAQYGNVGRFINHSCSPNLYAQNVIYDHDDKRMPHVMLFAMENIPPLQELTYHYNYSVDQIRDSNGNIKVKECYCGSSKCTGRMY